MKEQLEKFKDILGKVKEKDFTIYFFTMDAKGAPVASVYTNYMWAKYLKDAGYNVSILHEKKDYIKPDSWMGEEYEDIDHCNAEEKNVNITPQDIIMIPEIFSNVMEQTAQLPAKRIVFCQAYDHILEFMKPGTAWGDFGILDCVTTTESQAKYVNYLFPMVQTDVVNISIPEYFKPSDKLKKPIIGIHTRDPRHAMKVIKTFFLKYPQFKWVTFRDLKGLSREQFAEALKECCVAVWDDTRSGFGTFPIECFKTETPMIATRPSLVPDWFNEKSAMWVNDNLDIPDTLGNFFRAWIEDLVPQDLYDEMKTFKDSYQQSIEIEGVTTYFNDVTENRIKELEEQIEKMEKEVSDESENNPEVINLLQ